MITTKHKVFCSYALTGEDIDKVSERMKLIKDTFQKLGVQAYCHLLDSVRGKGPKVAIDTALSEMKSCDIVLAIMASERRSEGMLIELGAAYAAGKPIVLARHHTANGKTYLDQLAHKTVDWRSDKDLVQVIQTLVA